MGHTPLYLSCLANNPDCVRELLRAGADVSITGAAGDGPLQAAVEASNSLCAKEIMDVYPLYDKISKNGGTPLHWAKTTEVLENYTFIWKYSTYIYVFLNNFSVWNL